MDAPVVAAVNGSAGGAGLSLTCVCDIVLAAESARFTMNYTRVSLAPDGASTYFRSRIVGLRRALEPTLTNHILSAQEALDPGDRETETEQRSPLLNADRQISRRLLPNPIHAAIRLLRLESAESMD